MSRNNILLTKFCLTTALTFEGNTRLGPTFFKCFLLKNSLTYLLTYYYYYFPREFWCAVQWDRNRMTALCVLVAAESDARHDGGRLRSDRYIGADRARVGRLCGDGHRAEALERHAGQPAQTDRAVAHASWGHRQRVSSNLARVSK